MIVLLTPALSVTSEAEIVIESVTLESFDIPLKSAFVTSKGSSDSCYGILVTLHASDSTKAPNQKINGIGTILPRSLVSNETRKDAWSASQVLAKALIDVSFQGDDLDADLATAEKLINKLSEQANAYPLTTSNPPPSGKQLRATLCGIDIALLDLLGNIYDKPICDLFNDPADRPAIDRAAPTFGTDSDADALTRKVASAHSSYRAMRLKIGRDINDDPKRVAAVAKTLRAKGSPNAPIWVDVNQAWKTAEKSAHQLEIICEQLQAVGFTADFVVEQPTAEHDFEALAALTKITRGWGDRYGFDIYTMADESIWTVADAERVVELDAADMINIKIQKAGGVFGSLEIGRYLAEHSPQTGVCLGGLVMTDVGAWANVQVSFALPRLDYQTSGAPRRNFADNIASFPLNYTHGRTLDRPTLAGLGSSVDRDVFKKYVKDTADIGGVPVP